MSLEAVRRPMSGRRRHPTVMADVTQIDDPIPFGYVPSPASLALSSHHAYRSITGAWRHREEGGGPPIEEALCGRRKRPG